MAFALAPVEQSQVFGPAGDSIMNVRNWRIGTRLAAGFGISLAILAAMVSISVVLNSQNKQQLIAGLEGADAKRVLAATMKSALLEAGIAMRNIGLQGDVAAMQKEEARVKLHQKRYDDARVKLAALGLNEAEEQIVSRIAELDEKILVSLGKALGQALAFNSEGAAKAIAEQIDPLNQQSVAAIDKLVEIQQVAA